MMSQTHVLKSFAELAEFFDLNARTPDVPETDVGADPADDGESVLNVDLADLVAQLEDASGALATVARQDQETRTLALQEIERYDAAVAAQREADDALTRARGLRERASAFAEGAFAEEARVAARRIVGIARQAEQAAARLVEERDREVASLAARLDIERLLAERRRAEEAERTRAAEAERTQRLSEALARARSTLGAGDLQEAKALLGHLTKDNPDNADVASLLGIIARRELSVKVDATETALRSARRAYRQDPAGAVGLLAALDLDGLPDPLARQVFGEWARACARLCRYRGLVDPLRYAPDPGRGAVLARDGNDAPYTVLSALGLGSAWRPGSAVPERLLPRARPLR